MAVFPTRCTEPQVAALRELLWASLRWSVPRLEATVADKLTKEGLDPAQRALWLATGFLLAPDDFAPALIEFVRGETEVRCDHIVNFLHPSELQLASPEPGTRTLASMIALLGDLYAPWTPPDDLSWMGSPAIETRMKVDDLVRGWSRSLAARVEDDAVEALDGLARDVALEPWHPLLEARRVLWFGAEGVPPPPASTRPKTPQDLQRRLRETLTDAERRRVGLVVVDVSASSP